MVVHMPSGEDALLDFFVAARGKGSGREAGEITAFEVVFTDEAVQVFHAGPASCGVYGTPKGVSEAVERYGSMPLADLTTSPAQVAREGHEVNAIQAYVCQILSPILASPEEGGAAFSAHGRDIPTNRPPSPGGILIAYSLDLLERAGRRGALRALVGVMDETNKARTADFAPALHTQGYLERFLAKEAVESVAVELHSRLG